MSYKVLGALEYGQESGGAYPVPTKAKPGFVPSEHDTNPLEYNCRFIEVAERDADGYWRPILSVEIPKPFAKMFITDFRVVVTHDRAAKRGQSIVGHVRYQHLVAVGAHRKARGLTHFGGLMLWVKDVSGAAFRLTVDPAGLGADGPALGDDVLRRAIALHRTRFTNLNDEQRSAYTTLSERTFNVERKGTDVVPMPVYVEVGH